MTYKFKIGDIIQRTNYRGEVLAYTVVRHNRGMYWLKRQSDMNIGQHTKLSVEKSFRLRLDVDANSIIETPIGLCDHNMVPYVGFRESYHFCTKCDTKRSDPK